MACSPLHIAACARCLPLLAAVEAAQQQPPRLHWKVLVYCQRLRMGLQKRWSMHWMVRQRSWVPMAMPQMQAAVQKAAARLSVEVREKPEMARLAQQQKTLWTSG